MAKAKDLKEITNVYDQISLNIEQAIPVVVAALKDGMCPHLWGPPGVGKTDMVMEISRLMGCRRLCYIVPSQTPILDLYLPWVDPKSGKRRMAASPLIPTEEECMLFIDEINTADRMTQPALYSLLHGKRLGEIELPASTKIVSAGNCEFHNGATQPLALPAKTRMSPQIYVQPNAEVWKKWAYRNDVAPEVTSFINEFPNYIDAIDHEDPTGGCNARALVKLSKCVRQNHPPGIEEKVYRGTVGIKAGYDFMGHLTMFREGVQLSDVLKNPLKAEIPTKTAKRFALASMILGKLCNLSDTKKDADLADSCLQYLERMDESTTVWVLTAMLEVAREKIMGMPKILEVTTKYITKHVDVLVQMEFGRTQV